MRILREIRKKEREREKEWGLVCVNVKYCQIILNKERNFKPKITKNNNITNYIIFNSHHHIHDVIVYDSFFFL